ncbi:2-polyprenyl-3-methyl-5-hydroxy-6-metoxy-1,4-benzoquinol methylase/spore maturation protein CgeB [Sinorhizobium kostiense]|uniref:2-polyprenyl-3-methyl-5-hydroxy-6-metoxy-1, 4-benzoquinol methylase/spore maturation protein CgeB n=1 Tax=Sinorhizobium kostiense TaxID=76747 RepID=A0ABS4QSP5_9HYPH|nr:methyltransferase domain-containing protein [Sinorhizobium kostiense]MBP2233686.1 2-polyprenyl-3-methyl-5-hydroxy-6-metoxy-1,4-benzoquinol methylase/spore maturation protein CgeB [Sinorhizobium kostiense]
MSDKELQHGDELAASDCDDRISDVYKGGLWSRRLTLIAQRRIDWICDQVQGNSVLDVGCSQGIASVLLARRGFTVTGIDVSENAIEYALEDKAKESADVQARLDFALCAIEDFKSDVRFDNVILGEVLEHQIDPAAFIEVAVRHLEVNGRLIVTTPFGFQPYPDHKSQLFPAWFARLREHSLSFQSVDVQANYIRAVGTKLPEGQTVGSPSLRELLRVTERGALNAQKRLYSIIDSKTAKLNDEVVSLEKIILGKTNRIEELEARLADAQSQLATVEKEAEERYNLPALEVLRRYQKLHSRYEGLSRDIDKLKQGLPHLIGRELISSRKSIARIIKLPYTIYRLVKWSEEKFTAHDANFIKPPFNENFDIFLKKDPKWIRLEVTPGHEYGLSGTITSFRKENIKGALLTVCFEDDQGKAIPFRDRKFILTDGKAQAVSYLATGLDIPFEYFLLAPPRASVMLVGFSRFAEQIPIHVTVNPIGVIEGTGKLGQDAPDRPRIASIFDEFTHECFAPDVDLLPVTKASWSAQLKRRPPKAFFAESAWRGNNNEWKYAMTKPEKWGREIGEILNYCHSIGIPSLFWNKEDPVNFDVFRETAKKFDFVFTTDSGCVNAYRELTGKDNAFVLPFAAQPALHNPIRDAEKVNRVAFTGSWRGIKYPRRAEWLDLLLSPIMERGLLDIYDRYLDEKKNPDLIFPDKFKTSLKGSLEYTHLVEQVYKRYHTFVNVNSVEGSETMLARRVFEILACGAPVISSHSEAIEKTFGDIVLMPRTSKEVEAAVDRLFNAPFYRDRLAVRGVRLVHSQHTYRHRLEQIGGILGTPLITTSRRKASIIMCSKRPNFLKHAAEQARHQTYSDREIIFVKHSDEYNDDAIAEAFAGESKLIILEIGRDQVLADGLNLAMTRAEGDVFAKFDDDDHYGPNYLTDAMLAFDYAPAAALVGKQAFFAYVESMDKTVHRFPGKSYQFTNRVHGGTLVWDRRKTEGATFTRVPQGTDTLFLKTLAEQGALIFSTDPFNFIHVRHADLSKHTWKIGDHEFVSKAKAVGRGLITNEVFV